MVKDDIIAIGFADVSKFEDFSSHGTLPFPQSGEPLGMANYRRFCAYWKWQFHTFPTLYEGESKRKRGATPACLEVHLASRDGIEIVQAISLGERILETFLPRFGFSLGIDASAVREGFFEKLFHCHASFRLVSPRQFFRGTRNIARNLKKAKCKSNESVSKDFQFSHIAERARYISFRFNSKSDIKLANGKLKLKNSKNPLCH